MKAVKVKDRYVRRDLEREVEKFVDLRQVVAILGPRRSGKTTFLQHLAGKLEGSIYLSFEDQKVLDLFEGDIERFAKLHKGRYLILDEFHYAKKGGKQLKYLFDFHPDLKIFISGSSMPELTIKAIKYLVGRVVVFNLLPFSFQEYLRAKDEKWEEIYVEVKEQVVDGGQLKVSEAVGDKFKAFFGRVFVVWRVSGSGIGKR